MALGWGGEGCAHHAEGALEGRVLRLRALGLEERGKVEEDGLDVRPLLERAAQHLYARAGRVGRARAEPAVRAHADTTGALAHEGDRLLRGEQRRRPVHHLTRLKVLPPHDAEVVGLRAQPRAAHERDVAPLEHFDQPVVQGRERLVDLRRQCFLCLLPIRSWGGGVHSGARRADHHLREQRAHIGGHARLLQPNPFQRDGRRL